MDRPEELVLSNTSLDEEAWEDISQWRTPSVGRKYLHSGLLYVDLQRPEKHLFGGRNGEDNELNAT